MKTTIIIKKGKEEKTFECEGYYLILSDPNDFKGIIFRSSTGSIPRQMGWIQWAWLSLQKKADALFDYSSKKNRNMWKEEYE